MLVRMNWTAAAPGLARSAATGGPGCAATSGRAHRRGLPGAPGDGLRQGRGPAAGGRAVGGAGTAGGLRAARARRGSSRSGPESTTALMTAAALAPLAAGDPGRYAALAAVLALLVGVLCLVGRAGPAGLPRRPAVPAGAGRLPGRRRGHHDRQPAGQAHRRAGRAATRSSPRSRRCAQRLGDGHRPTLAARPRRAGAAARGWPGCSRAARAADRHAARGGRGGRCPRWSTTAFGVVGDVPGGLPGAGAAGCPPGATSATLVLPAVGIAIVGYSDNVLTARTFAARKGDDIDANAELLALGAAQLGAGLIHGFPVSSSGSRTAIGDAGRQPHPAVLAGRAGVSWSSLWSPRTGARHVPDRGAGRAGDLRRAAAHRRRRVPAARPVPAQRAASSRWPPPSGCSCSACCTACWRRSGCRSWTCCAGSPVRTTGSSASCRAWPGMHDIDDYPEARRCPACWSTATTRRCSSPTPRTSAPGPGGRRRTTRIPVEWFVLNAEANVEVDLTALDAVDAIAHGARPPRHRVRAWRGSTWHLRDALGAAGLLDKIGEDRMFMTLPTAVEAYRNRRTA